MVVPKPIFITRLQCGALSAGIINIILSGITLLILIVWLIILTIQDEEVHIQATNSNIALAVISVIFVLICIADLIVSGILLCGASNNNKQLCWIWLIVEAVSFVLYVVLSIVALVLQYGGVQTLERSDTTALVLNILFRIIWILLVLWEMWVVYAYIDELTRLGANPGQPEIYPDPPQNPGSLPQPTAPSAPNEYQGKGTSPQVQQTLKPNENKITTV